MVYYHACLWCVYIYILIFILYIIILIHNYTYSSWSLWTNLAILGSTTLYLGMSEGMPTVSASFVKVHSWFVFFQCLFKKSEAPIGMWMDWIFPAQQVEVREQVLTSFMQECLRSKKEKIMNALPILHNRDLKSFWHSKNINIIKRFCDFSCVKLLSKKLHKLNG